MNMAVFKFNDTLSQSPTTFSILGLSLKRKWNKLVNNGIQNPNFYIDVQNSNLLFLCKYCCFPFSDYV